MSRRALISPRAGLTTLGDLGERSAFVRHQRVGRPRRPRTRRRVRWLRTVGLGALFGGTALAVVAGWLWLMTSPVFAVTTVDVQGTSRVPPARILRAAGIASGSNLWTLDVGGARARIEDLAEIQRADIIRELPNRVTILVEERRPFTLVHAGRLHWMDEEGRVLGEEPRAVTPEVPLISGLTEEEIATMRAAPSPKARAAVALIRALLRSGSTLASEISEIDMSRPDGPVLYTVDGVEVRLGHEHWEERLARLEGVLAQVATQDVRGVDLRFRDQVVLRKTSR